MTELQNDGWAYSEHSFFLVREDRLGHLIFAKLPSLFRQASLFVSAFFELVTIKSCCELSNAQLFSQLL
jgi:hypothetical protein